MRTDNRKSGNEVNSRIHLSAQFSSNSIYVSLITKLLCNLLINMTEGRVCFFFFNVFQIESQWWQNQLPNKLILCFPYGAALLARCHIYLFFIIHYKLNIGWHIWIQILLHLSVVSCLINPSTFSAVRVFKHYLVWWLKMLHCICFNS